MEVAHRPSGGRGDLGLGGLPVTGVVAYVPDLMDRSRLRAVDGVTFVGRPEDLFTRGGGRRPRRGPRPPRGARGTRGGSRRRRIVGYASHVDRDLIAEPRRSASRSTPAPASSPELPLAPGVAGPSLSGGQRRSQASGVSARRSTSGSSFPGHEVGEGHVLEDGAEVAARSAIQTRWSESRSPGYASSSGGSPRTSASGPSTARMMSATVTSSGRPVQPVAAVRAAHAADQAGALEVGEDVLQELRRDLLRGRRCCWPFTRVGRTSSSVTARASSTDARTA